MAKTESRLPSRASEREASLAAVKAGQDERLAAAIQSDLDMVAGVKARARKAQESKAPESLGRCTIDGEPTGAKHNVPPVEGTVMPNDDNTGNTGVCKLCGTRAKLHGKRGVMLMHVMRGETLPVLSADKRLAEPRVQPTDTGSRTGDPESGSKRRADDIDGAFERGTVWIKVDGERVEVPATLENLRTALAREKKRRLTKRESIVASQAYMTSLRRRIKAAEAGPEAMDAPSVKAVRGVGVHANGRSVGQRGEARIDGVAMVQGHDTGTDTHKQWQARQTGKPGPTTLDEPLGRERPDATIVGDEPTVGGRCGYLTQAEYQALSRRSQKRYWVRVKANRESAKRARAYAKRVEGPPMSGKPFGCKALVDAPEGSSLHETASVMGQAPGGNSERMERIASRS